MVKQKSRLGTGRSLFGTFAPSHLREQACFLMKIQNGAGGCHGPSPRKAAAGSHQALCPLPADWESGAGRPLGNFASRPHPHPIGESIEILVSPFFCLSPTHMVLSLVSHFSFLSFLKFFFFFPLGDKIGHLNKSSFLVSKEVSSSQKSLKRKSADPTHGKGWRFPLSTSCQTSKLCDWMFSGLVLLGTEYIV